MSYGKLQSFRTVRKHVLRHCYNDANVDVGIEIQQKVQVKLEGENGKSMTWQNLI